MEKECENGTNINGKQKTEDVEEKNHFATTTIVIRNNEENPTNKRWYS